MRKLTTVPIVLLIFLLVLLPLVAIGLRDVLLRHTDCPVCRRIFSLAFQPDNYNAPIAIDHIVQGTSRFYLFPSYVGPYFLEVYGTSGKSEIAVVNFSCSAAVRLKAVSGPGKLSKVFSSFGHGLILGSFYLLPEHVITKQRIACDIEVASAENMLLVVTRASEL